MSGLTQGLTKTTITAFKNWVPTTNLTCALDYPVLVLNKSISALSKIDLLKSSIAFTASNATNICPVRVASTYIPKLYCSLDGVCTTALPILENTNSELLNSGLSQSFLFLKNKIVNEILPTYVTPHVKNIAQGISQVAKDLINNPTKFEPFARNFTSISCHLTGFYGIYKVTSKILDTYNDPKKHLPSFLGYAAVAGIGFCAGNWFENMS